MEDLIKNIIYTGVGVAATATEKVQSTVDELVKKSKDPRKEGKKVVEGMTKQGEGLREDVEDRVKRTVKSVVERFDYPSRKDYENLLKRVEKLEKAARAQRSAKATRTTVKKAAAKTAKTASKAVKSTKAAAKKVASDANKATK